MSGLSTNRHHMCALSHQIFAIASSRVLCSRHRTWLRRLYQTDHMTKTLVASRQVSTATAGRFVKNFIGLLLRPASSEYGAQASPLVVYIQATSASLTRRRYCLTLFPSRSWSSLPFHLEALEHDTATPQSCHLHSYYLGVEPEIVSQRWNRSDVQPRALVWALNFMASRTRPDEWSF